MSPRGDHAPNSSAECPEKSCYEDYDTTFNEYDSYRVPVGASNLLTAFAKSATPLASQRVLEGGCGTGSYVAAVSPHVGMLIGVEASTTGLEKAGQKIGARSNVTLLKGNILSLDRETFHDASFDSMMVNQVLHHIDDNDDSYPNLTRFRDEAARVVKSGGILTVITSSHEQLALPTSSYWYYRYIPKRVDKIVQRTIATPALIERMLGGGKFEHMDTVPIKEELFDEKYWDMNLLLSESFRASDSTFSGMSQEELRYMKDTLDKDIASGYGEKHLEQTKHRLNDIGMSVLVSFRRT